MGGTNEDKIVARLSEMTARKYGVHEIVIKRLYVAALLHDIGKLSLPDSIVNKTGRLTADEFNVMKTHTKLGAEMLEHIQGDLGVTVRAVCLWHHEKWNGTGYWEKYSCDLPVGVSIVGIADTFVALCSSRSYKEAWTPAKAMEYIRGQAGKQFSHSLVDVFLTLVRSDENLTALFAGKINMNGGVI